jgi:hypothetical protein
MHPLIHAPSLTQTGADAAPPLPLASLGFIGEGLVRPECVLATAAGDLYTADWRGGVAHLLARRHATLYTGTMPDGLARGPTASRCWPTAVSCWPTWATTTAASTV